MTVGDNIRYYRKKNDLTQAMLADLAGIHVVTIRKYEANKIQPSLATAQKLADALKVSINDLVEEGRVLPTQGIGYKVGGEFEDLWKDGIWVGFDILFPFVYETQGAAGTVGSNNTSAWMEKEENGEVVIRLYEFGEPVETIHWDEWWKYKCYRTKEASKGKTSVEGHMDFEPCSEKFETIFDGYVSNRADVTHFEMQYLAYWVEPALIPEQKE